jgi:Protein of unknown function (DUF2628)
MFARNTVKYYTVYQKPTDTSPPVLVRAGFSKGAFIFGGLWLFYHRAWSAGALVLLLSLVLYWLEQQGILAKISVSALQLILHYWIGSEARDWQSDALVAQGYNLSDIVVESDEDRALLRYYERHVMVSGEVLQHSPKPV